jgi:hypothetical protein
LAEVPSKIFEADFALTLEFPCNSVVDIEQSDDKEECFIGFMQNEGGKFLNKLLFMQFFGPADLLLEFLNGVAIEIGDEKFSVILL